MYRYNPYTSVYRDPQSVKVNELLRQRFQNAFNADDLTAAAVKDMDVADFEGDQLAKESLQNEIQEELRARSERGDYETMMMDVSRSARKFQDKYKPIKENYDRFEAYKATLKKAFEDGTITGPTKQRLLKLSQHGYGGLQYDENGEVDEDSYFNGAGFVKDINIQEHLAKRIKKLSPTGNIRKRNYLGVPATFKNPITGEKTEIPMFEVETEYGWEEVTPERVKAIFDNMMQEPEVMASLNQQVRLGTFDIEDESLQTELYTALHGEGGIYDKIEEAEQENDLKALGVLKAFAEEAEGLMKATPEERMDYKVRQARNSIYERELNAALNQYSWRKVTKDSYIQKYDPLYLKSLENNEETPEEPFDPPIGNSDVWEMKAPGGKTIDSVTESSVKVEKDQSGRIENYNQLKGTNYTAEQILSNSIQSDDPDFKALQAEVKELDIEKALLTSRLATAALITNHAFSWEEEVEDYINKEFEPKEAGVSFHQDTQKDPINKLAFIRAINEAFDANFNTFADVVEKGIDLNERAHIGGAGLDPDAKKKYATFVETYKKETGKNIGQRDMGGLKKTYNHVVSKIKNKWNSDINDHLEKTSITQTSGKISPYMPALTEKEAKKKTALWEGYFMGKNAVGVQEGDLIYFKDEEGITQKGTLADLTEAAKPTSKTVPVSSWEAVSVKFPLNATGHTAGLLITMKGKREGGAEDVKKDIFYPIENASNLALVESYNTPSFKLSSLIQQVTSTNKDLKGFSIEFVDKQGQVRKRGRIHKGYGDLYKIDIEGMGDNYSLSDPAVLRGVDEMLKVDGFSMRLDKDSFQDPRNVNIETDR